MIVVQTVYGLEMSINHTSVGSTKLI